MNKKKRKTRTRQQKADRLNPCIVILVMPDSTVISGKGTWCGHKIGDTAVVSATLPIKMKP